MQVLQIQQVTSKLNYPHVGMYFMYRGAVLGSTGFISLLFRTSFINREILPDEDSATPNLSLNELLVRALPSIYFIQACKYVAIFYLPLGYL